jgi:hypothetical protein
MKLKGNFLTLALNLIKRSRTDNSKLNEPVLEKSSIVLPAKPGIYVVELIFWIALKSLTPCPAFAEMTGIRHDHRLIQDKINYLDIYEILKHTI